MRHIVLIFKTVQFREKNEMTFERLLFVFWFSKSHFNVSQAERLLVETLQKKNKYTSQIQNNLETSLNHFSVYVPFCPPVINHIYRLWTVYNSSLSYSSIRGKTCWGKLTQLTCTKVKSRKAFIFKNIIIISFSLASEQHNFVWLQAVHSCIINDWTLLLHLESSGGAETNWISIHKAILLVWW